MKSHEKGLIKQIIPQKVMLTLEPKWLAGYIRVFNKLSSYNLLALGFWVTFRIQVFGIKQETMILVRR